MSATTAFREPRFGIIQRMAAFFALITAVVTEALAMHREFGRRYGNSD